MTKQEGRDFQDAIFGNPEGFYSWKKKYSPSTQEVNNYYHTGGLIKEMIEQILKENVGKHIYVKIEDKEFNITPNTVITDGFISVDDNYRNGKRYYPLSSIRYILVI